MPGHPGACEGAVRQRKLRGKTCVAVRGKLRRGGKWPNFRKKTWSGSQGDSWQKEPGAERFRQKGRHREVDRFPKMDRGVKGGSSAEKAEKKGKSCLFPKGRSERKNCAKDAANRKLENFNPENNCKAPLGSKRALRQGKT